MRWFAGLAAVAASAAQIRLPCDPGNPYTAPRDARLEQLWKTPVRAELDCGKADEWLGPWASGPQSPLAAFSESHNDSLHWGLFVPEEQFSIRTRTERAALQSGVRWGRGSVLSGQRHMKRTKWTSSDPRTFSEMELEDQHAAAVSVSFVKPRHIPSDLLRPARGSPEWAVRVHASVAKEPLGTEAHAHARRHHKRKAEELGSAHVYWYLTRMCADESGCGFRMRVSAEGSAAVVTVDSPPGVASLSGSGPHALRLTAEALGPADDAEPTAAPVEVACGQDPDEVIGDWAAWSNTSCDSAATVVIRADAPSPLHSVTVDVSFGRAELPPHSAETAAEWRRAGASTFYRRFQRGFGIDEGHPGYTTAREAIATLMASAAFLHGPVDVRAEKVVAQTEPVTLFGFAPFRGSGAFISHYEDGYQLLAALRYDRGIAAEVLARWVAAARGHAVCSGAWIPTRLARPTPSATPADRWKKALSMRVFSPPTLVALVAEPLLVPPDDAAVCDAEDSEQECQYDPAVLRTALLPSLRAALAFVDEHQRAPSEAYFRPIPPPPAYWEEDEDEEELSGLSADALTLADEQDTEEGFEWPETGLYQWRGREPSDGLVSLTVSSGLADYPRSYWPSNHEAHADLAAWVAAGHRSLARVLEATAEQGSREGEAVDEQAAGHRRTLAQVLRALDAYHWDSASGTYADRGLVSTAAAPQNTVAAGTVVRSGVSMRSEAVIICAQNRTGEDAETATGGVPESVLTAIMQQERWGGELWEDMRVTFNATVQFPKSKRIVAQGTPATVRRIPGSRPGTAEIQTDTGVVFSAGVEDLAPLLSSQNVASFCPPGFPLFLELLSDGKNGLLQRQRLASFEAPQPGRVTSAVGVAGIMPLLLRLLPYEGSDRVDQMIATLTQSLLGPRGMRSLSGKSPLYQVPNTARGSDPLFRGAVWYHLNHLAISALRHYSQLGSAVAQQVLDVLEAKAVATVMTVRRRTGAFWERYDDGSGEAKGRRGRLGGTALVANGIAKLYD